MANPSPESDRQQFSVLNYKSTSQIPKAAKSPDQTKFEALMIVNFLVTFGGCVLSCGGAFIFDAPNSEKNPATVALFWTILALPFTSVGSLLVAGSLKNRERLDLGWKVMLIPAIDIVLIFASVIWLTFRYHGQFNGK